MFFANRCARFEGDRVPADAVLVEAHDLQAEWPGKSQ
jgi:hypothetical protein